MAITQIRGAQVLDATITEDDLNTSVAGNGISGGGGAALALALSELSTAAVDVANDSLALLDAGDSSSKTESIANIMTAVAGDGLGATSGVLEVNVDASTITIAGDTLGVPTDGITANELATDSVDSAEIVAGAVDVDHLSDLRVTEGTGVIADFAAGTLRVDNGSTVTVLSIAASTIAVDANDVSFVEVDSSGTVSKNIVGFTQGRIPLAEVTADIGGDITLVTDKRAWLDIETGTTGLVESNFVDNEVPTGDLDGADVTYTLANTPSPAGSLRVYLNGIRQDEGGSDDYTLTTNVITFAAAPVSTDKILVDYRKA